MPLSRRNGLFAFLILLFACAGDEGAGPHPIPSAVEIVAGASQTGPVAQPLPATLTVQVLDADGDPVRGVTVTFALSGAAGTLSATSVKTAVTGRAGVIWTLPPIVGAYSASARVGALDSVQFQATAVAAAAGSITILSGDSQVTTAGAFADSAIVVKVTDPFGNPVASQVVVLAPSGDGSVPALQILTDSLGIARTRWMVGATRRVAALRFIISSVLSRAVSGFALSPLTSDSLAVAPFHACQLDRGGVLRCWGLNGTGELGNGTTVTAHTPIVVGTGTGFLSLAAGNGTTCALDAAGAAFCWGYSGVYSSVPAPVPGGQSFTTVSAGSGHACGLLADGTALCWGGNNQWQIGDGTQLPRTTPKAVSGGHRFRRIRAADQATCGITLDGRTYCWGVYGHVPTLVNTPQVFDQVSPAANQICALNADGQVYCWGVGALQPQAVATALRFRSLSAGFAFACGVATIGGVYCWGENYYGQLGIGTADWNGTTTPAQAVIGGNVFTEVHADGERACGLEISGVVSCWGSNFMGAMGVGDPRGLVPDSVHRGHRFTQLASGSYHTCGLALDGSTWCWGQNSQGQLGSGDRQWSALPQAVPGAPSFVSLVANGYTTCGLTTAGTVYCWGIYGSMSLAPALIPGNQSFTAIFAGFGWACGPSTTGVTLCFGNNGVGQLGDGGQPGTPGGVPVVVAGGHLFIQMAGGADNTCGVTAQGAGYCWGGNGQGQLGDGTVTNRTVPVPISGGHQFRRLSAFFLRTCGITTADDAYCWGNNILQPAPIPGGLKWTLIASSLGTDCGITTTGVAVCRGNGYLGRGANESSTDPVPVSGSHNFVAMAAGWIHTCGLDTAGQAWCWGDNLYGELGNGQRGVHPQPVPVP